MHRILSIFFACLSISGFSFADDIQCPKLATTTSVKSSGLINILGPLYEAEHGCKLTVHIKGSGAALRLGRLGEVDVVLVHAPSAEEEFIQEGYGIKRVPIMSNDFLIVGPANDPANLNKATSIADAFMRLSNTKSLFFSRGDDSGTHKKEQALWRAAKIEPYGSWYYEAGMGMGKLLTLAQEQQGYILLDRGTWLLNKDRTSLKVSYEGGEDLINHYSIIAISPQEDAKINTTGANAFINWMTSKRIQKTILNYKINGEQLFQSALLEEE